MKLVRAFPLEAPPVELPWRLSRAGIETLLAGAKVAPVPGGGLRLQSKLLGGLAAAIELRFDQGRQAGLREIELLRKPRRHKRREFDDLQRRLEAWLGPPREVKSDLTARADGVTPAEWDLGRLQVRHDYYYQFALYEKVLFTWNG